MKPVKFGIIGCGVIGTVHLKSVHEVANVDVVAVADAEGHIATTGFVHAHVGQAGVG